MSTEFIVHAGKAYQLSPLSVSDRADFQAWANAEAIRLAEDRIAMLARHDCIAPWERRQLLDQVDAANGSGVTVTHAAETDAGLVTLAWLSLRGQYPTLQREGVGHMLAGPGAIVMLRKQLEVINFPPQATPIEEPAEPSPQPVNVQEEHRTAMETVFGSMCAAAGKSPKEVAALPIGELETLYRAQCPTYRQEQQLQLRQEFLSYAGVVAPSPPAASSAPVVVSADTTPPIGFPSTSSSMPPKVE